MWVCVCEYGGSYRPDELGPGAGGAGAFESPIVGAGNQTQVLQEQHIVLIAEPPF